VCSRGGPRLPKAATRLPMPRTPGTPRTPSLVGARKDQRSVPSSSGCARPQAYPPLIRRSLGSAPVALKGSHLLWLRRTLAPCPDRAAAGTQPGRRGELSFPAGRELFQRPSTFLRPNRSSLARLPGPSEPSSPRTAAAAAAPPWPPASRPLEPLHPPSNPSNRSLGHP
jgi:hypothetical protein